MVIEMDGFLSVVHDIWTVVLPIAMGYIIALLRKQRTQSDARSKATMLMMRIQLIEYHDRYIEKGSIPSYAYDNFIEMYQVYHELGGNGMVTKMKNEIENLHLGKREDDPNE